MDVAQAKAELRRVMLGRRKALDAVARARAAADTARVLADLPAWAGARIVAGFLSVRAEIDCRPALAVCRQRGLLVVFPRVSQRRPRLRFLRAGDATDCAPGAYGVLEPRSDHPEVPAAAVDVWLLPGLAFDRDGGRLGYGGGYYDELVAHRRRSPGGVFVGMGFDFQLVPRCPVATGDERIDYIATDERLVQCF